MLAFMRICDLSNTLMLHHRIKKAALFAYNYKINDKLGLAICLIHILRNTFIFRSMKHLVILTILCFSAFAFAQQETEIFLLDANIQTDTVTFKNAINISQNKGYDSQPSFLDTDKLLFAGTENKQTEIMQYNLLSGATQKVNVTTKGGEYSPQKFPTKDKIAAVRLDPDGLQRLYKYDYSLNGTGANQELIADYKVAYFTFHDDDNIVATIIQQGDLNLIKANLSTGKVEEITNNSGRSIHKVPQTENVSYTAINEDGVHEVYIINIGGDNESYYVCDLPIGIEDHCWLSSSDLLIGSGSKLYRYDLFGNAKWEEVADLSNENISEISRITLSPDRKKLALVGIPEVFEKSPEAIVDEHIAPFNERRLEDFGNAFTEDVVVKRFPADTISVGRNALMESYQSFFNKVKDVKVSVNDRIVHNEWVIDNEFVNQDGKSKNQITLYKTRDGLIAEMIFLPSKPANNAASLAEEQIKGYNARDIAAFVKPYGKNVIAINYPDTLLLTGKEALIKGYKSFFANTPDLYCNIKNRLVNGNIVVDQEEVLINGKTINAVAIYEIENNEIVKVTFLPD